MRSIYKLIFLFGSILLSIAGSAQTTCVGFTAGTGLSWISNITPAGQKAAPAIAVNFGATIIYNTDGKLGFSGDVLFSSEGTDYSNTTIQPTSKTKFNSEYIRVPLKAIYYFNAYRNKIRPSVFAGPDIGFLTGGKIFTRYTNGYVVREYVNNVFKHYDVGVIAGGGLSFSLGDDLWLNANVAYYQGLVKQNTAGSKNANLEFNASVTFGLNRKWR